MLLAMVILALVSVASCSRNRPSRPAAEAREEAEKQPTKATKKKRAPGPRWLVITRPMFVKALQPLADHRHDGGLDVKISVEAPGRAIKAAGRRPAYILLVGDEVAGGERPWRVASPRRKLYRWRSVQRHTFAADALWGDLDGDLVPDVPVGRLPVRAVKGLGRVIKKILAREARPPWPADLRVLLWTGSPGYNAMVDTFTTNLLLQATRRHGPAWASYWAISADPAHALCGWPPDHARMFNQALKRGGALAVLMGHASVESFHSMRFRGKSIDYSARDARDDLARGDPAPPLVLFSCSSGDFTRDAPCLAESLLELAGGPVAVLAATTESHPLTNYFSGKNTLQALRGKHSRLGDLWLAAQRAAMGDSSILMERVLARVEGSLEPEINTGKLRRDQMLMYALLGDPATAIHLPRKLSASLEATPEGWRWRAKRPPNATRLHVSFRRAGLQVPKVKGPKDRARAAALFDQANATITFNDLTVASKAWQGAIAHGPGTLRLVATGGGKIYATTLKVKEKEKDQGLPK